jgi:serine/threonine protein kinase
MRVDRHPVANPGIVRGELLQPGQMVGGKYRVERELGVGGMGVVYIAKNVILERQVALKVLSPEMAQQPEFVGRFLREAVAATRTNHPGIVQVFDAGHDAAGGPWIAMELLQGETLRARLAKVGRLSIADSLLVGKSVLDALAAVHDAGIVHRDLKPDNVFLELTSEGTERTKLLDFGIAKQLDALTELTASGMVMGTARYLAPEQARNARAVDARTDIYAIGTILYECMSGTTPYDAETTGDLLAKLLTEAPRDLRALAPHVPEGIVNIVSSCLAHQPSSRPQSARALIALLDAADRGALIEPPPMEHSAPAIIPPTIPPVARTEAIAPQKSRAALWFALVAFVIAMAATAAAAIKFGWLAI